MNWKRNHCRSQKRPARSRNIVWFGLLLLCARISAAAPVDEFKAANQLYDQGRFTEAVAAYEKIEPKTAHVYYNLGNAWFREGKLGLAILNYERARRLAPRDPDILANLKFAEQKLGVDDVNTPPRAIQRLLRSVIVSRTPTEWSIYELVALWLTVLAVAAWIFLPKARTGCLIVSLVGFVALAVSAGALGYQMIEERTAPEAIVVATESTARFAPLPDSTVHFRLAEGTKVVILEDRGPWLCVGRADGQQGWVNAQTITRVAPS
jgi:tetratricopeptide (TPR) repeat protein